MLRDAGRKAKLPVITEIMSADKLPVFLEDGVDIIQLLEHAELRPPQSRRQDA